jgi:lipopolysaccharide/colanic/teichoic acid biosynthesis glycosyltransferase
MKVNSQEETGWSTNSDPRKTKFGSFIRKFSIDELPQFFNVLKGDMSLVGPRPELPLFVENFKDEIPLYMVKHQVKPGITGHAQVNGYRGDTSIKKRIEFDIYYIENWNILLDISILFKTAFKGFKNNEQLLKNNGETIKYNSETTKHNGANL